MKKILVFGSSGFLGSYLVHELRQRGYHVTGADLHSEDHEHFVKTDILDPDAVQQVIGMQDFDAIYNLAGFASLDQSVHHPAATMQLNVMGNIHILEVLREKAYSGRFVYASSVYAGNIKGAFYGISKMTSEKLVEEYHRRYGLTYTILRYGSIYSDANFENNYIYNLIRQAVETGKIDHSGDGEEIREYIHARDAAKLSADIIEADKFIGKKLILTGVERLRRSDLFNIINEMMGGNIQINYLNKGYEHHYKYTPYNFASDINEKLVANPFVDIGQGLLECIRAVYQENDES